MARKRFKPEEIVANLWQVEVLTAQGKTRSKNLGCLSSAWNFRKIG